MGVIRYKIWRDLWENKGRTWRVIAIIAIGVFAVGSVLSGKEFIRQDVTRAWQSSHPATIGLEVNPPVDDALIESLENLQEIEIVEGWFQDKTVRWRRSPYDPWQPALLVALADYEDQTIRQVTLDSGDWPQRKLMGVQRGRGLEVGDQVELQLDNQVYPVELNGVLYNAVHPSPMMLPGPMFSPPASVLPNSPARPAPAWSWRPSRITATPESRRRLICSSTSWKNKIWP